MKGILKGTTRIIKKIKLRVINRMKRIRRMMRTIKRIVKSTI
jgi:hypothetical protein